MLVPVAILPNLRDDHDVAILVHKHRLEPVPDGAAVSLRVGEAQQLGPGPRAPVLEGVDVQVEGDLSGLFTFWLDSSLKILYKEREKCFLV